MVDKRCRGSRDAVSSMRGEPRWRSKPPSDFTARGHERGGCGHGDETPGCFGPVRCPRGVPDRLGRPSRTAPGRTVGSRADEGSTRRCRRQAGVRGQARQAQGRPGRARDTGVVPTPGRVVRGRGADDHHHDPPRGVERHQGAARLRARLVDAQRQPDQPEDHDPGGRSRVPERQAHPRGRRDRRQRVPRGDLPAGDADRRGRDRAGRVGPQARRGPAGADPARPEAIEGHAARNGGRDARRDRREVDMDDRLEARGQALSRATMALEQAQTK